MNIKEMSKRYLVLTIGLFVLAFGVAMTVKAGLGISPISSLPYVFSVKFDMISLGTFTFINNIIIVIAQIIILRKNFKAVDFLQIPISIIFGFFIDVSLFIIKNVQPENYINKIILLLIGCVFLALGITFTYLANVALNPGEAIVKVISTVTKKEFGYVKVVFDVSLVLLTLIFSLLFFGNIVGIREGTVINAVCLGFVIKFFNHIFEKPIVKFINK